jgi:hypothetical protein
MLGVRFLIPWYFPKFYTDSNRVFSSEFIVPFLLKFSELLQDISDVSKFVAVSDTKFLSRRYSEFFRVSCVFQFIDAN